MKATCPWCNRRAPMLFCVAVVFGRRYHACGRATCQESQRSLADNKRDSEEAHAAGSVAVNALSATDGFGRGVLILVHKSLESKREAFVDAATKVLNPWHQTEADRSAYLYMAEVLKNMAARKDPDEIPR